MKNYKDYPLIGFGMSDMASLVLVYFDNTESFDDLMECAREQDEAGMKVAKGFMGY